MGNMDYMGKGCGMHPSMMMGKGPGMMMGKGMVPPAMMMQGKGGAQFVPGKGWMMAGGPAGCGGPMGMMPEKRRTWSPHAGSRAIRSCYKGPEEEDGGKGGKGGG